MSNLYKLISKNLGRANLALIISIITAICGGWHIWYTEFRVSNDVKACVLSFDPSRIHDANFYISDIVFINNGNRPCSIIRVRLYCSNETNKSRIGPIRAKEGIINVAIRNGTTKNLKYLGTRIYEASNVASFTLNPKDVVTKQLHFDTSSLKDDLFQEFGEKKDILDVGLIFEGIDYLGNQFEVTKKLVSKEVGEGQWNIINSDFKSATTLIPFPQKSVLLEPFSRLNNTKN